MVKFKMFKTGDMVSCHDFTGTSGQRLMPGEIYTVVKTRDDKDGPTQILGLNGFGDSGFYAYRFNLFHHEMHELDFSLDDIHQAQELYSKIEGSK